MITKAKRVTEIVDFALDNGDEKACAAFDLNAESLGRYKRQYKNTLKKDLSYVTVLKKIGETYTPKELQAIASGGRLVPGYKRPPAINFEGEHVRFAHMTDSHMGGVYFVEECWDAAIDRCKRTKVSFICHTGDITEGMSRRDGQIYELTHIGFDAQKDYAIEQMAKWTKPWFCIDGNHDRWFMKSNGALIVKDICNALPNATYLGQDEGDISLKGEGDISLKGVVLKLWHGEDASSYATSYRIQKVIEAFTGGEKPHILCLGHTHKQVYMFERHVHAVSGGAMCKQSAWMRGKRLANHMGFHIIDVWVNKDGVARFRPEWIPFYL